jgi:hypothetical protein
MKFEMSFDMDNAAFEDQPATEAGRIINQTARKLMNGETEGKVRDINGNIIGQWSVKK